MKLNQRNEKLLLTIQDKALKNDTRLSDDEMRALEIVYHAITKRVLSKGCSTCITDAFKIIRNYLLKFPFEVVKAGEVIADEILNDFEAPKLINEVKPKPKKKPTTRKKRTRK